MKDLPTFSPVFLYTHAMVSRLAAIAAAREVILHARLVPKWEVSIRREQLVLAAHASTAIEGNPLSLEEVSRLAQGREVMAARRAKAEVLNYLKVLEHIERYQQEGAITRENLLFLHRDITQDTLDDPASRRSVPHGKSGGGKPAYPRGRVFPAAGKRNCSSGDSPY